MNDILRGTVAGVRTLTPHVREVMIAPETVLDYTPGQWLSLRLPVGEKPPLNRAYSLATAPQPKGLLTLCLDHVPEGMGSGYLWECQPGTMLEFTGPHGNFVLPKDDGPLLFVARYTGIVPFRAMWQTLGPNSTRSVHLVYSAPEPQELLYREEINALTTQNRFFTVEMVNEGEETRALDRWTPSQPDFIPMVCGLREFNKLIRDYLMARFGFDRKAVLLENFS